MSQGKTLMEFHHEQYEVNRVVIARMRALNFTPTFVDTLAKLAEELHAAADYEFCYGDPTEAFRRCATQTTFTEVLSEILKEQTRSKNE